MMAKATIAMSGVHAIKASARRRAAAEAGSAPTRTRCTATAKNVGIVTDHVTMHQGQRVASTKMLCEMSQRTKAKAAVTPSPNSTQNHRAKRAPASSAAPTTIGATQPVRPRIGFGNPNTDPCADSRFLPHWTSRLMSQDAADSGFSRRWKRSVVSWKAANQPTTPAKMSHRAKTVGREVRLGEGMRAIIAPRVIRSLRRRPCISEGVGHGSGSGSGIMGVDVPAAAPPGCHQKTSGEQRPRSITPPRVRGSAADQMSSRHTSETGAEPPDFRRTARGAVGWE